MGAREERRWGLEGLVNDEKEQRAEGSPWDGGRRTGYGVQDEEERRKP